MGITATYTWNPEIVEYFLELGQLEFAGVVGVHNFELLLKPNETLGTARGNALFKLVNLKLSLLADRTHVARLRKLLRSLSLLLMLFVSFFLVVELELLALLSRSVCISVVFLW